MRSEGAGRVNRGWCRYLICWELGSGCMGSVIRLQLLVSRSRPRRSSGFGGRRLSGGGGLRLRKLWQRSGNGRLMIFELLCVSSARAMRSQGQGVEVGKAGFSGVRRKCRGCGALTCSLAG